MNKKRVDSEDYAKAQGHWILARMGKRVLRPGGRELTEKLIGLLDINSSDDIAEFAPGLGFTAEKALEKRPKSYTGIDLNADVIALLEQKLKGKNINFVLANAAETSLPDSSKDKVWGEAMLTMHADHRKTEIIREAHRILKKGGLYAIHELSLLPNDLDKEKKAVIQKDLALSIKVNARPLTESEWMDLLVKEGFKIRKIETNTMRLLQLGRIISDEGFFRTIKIVFNILTHPTAMRRILNIRRTFQKHKKNIHAIALVAEKV